MPILFLSLSLPAPVVPSIDFQDVGHSSGRPPANKPNQEQDVPNCRATFAYRFVAKLDHPSNRADDYYPPSINGKCLNNRIDFRYFPSFSILPPGQIFVQVQIWRFLHSLRMKLENIIHARFGRIIIARLNEMELLEF